MADTTTPMPETDGADDFERWAIASLHAWNGIENNGTFAWPKDFPIESRNAWRRVVTAIVAGSSSGRTAHFECANDGSNPSPASNSHDTLKSETARLREQVKELHGLVLALLDNDPDDMAADGVTVLDVWRKSARDLMEKTNA